MRHDWLDTAKGSAIIMVVFAHSLSWLGLGGEYYPVLGPIRDAVSTVMLPVFFCASGLVAMKTITSTWRVWWQRIATLVWVFLLWQVVVFAYKLVGDLVVGGGTPMSLTGHVLRAAVFPVRPNGELWYLWALVLFFLAAKVLVRVDRRVVVGVAAAIAIVWSAAKPALPDAILEGLGVGYNGVLTYGVFFLIGAFYRRAVIEATESTGRGGAILLAFIWLAIVTGSQILGMQHEFYFELAACGFGLAAMFAVAQHILPKRSIMQRIGRSWTMQVFVTHTAILVVFGSLFAVAGYRFSPDRIDSLLLPFAAVAAAVALGVLIGRSVAGTRAAWLFEAPAWFARTGGAGRTAPRRDGAAEAISS